MTDIIGIGSGVSGLSSALQSQQAGFKVSSITRDRPQNTTSIAADPTAHPIRGQTLLLDAPQITQGYIYDHSFSYLFPRGDGLLRVAPSPIITVMPASAIPCHGDAQKKRGGWRKPSGGISQLANLGEPRTLTAI